MPERTFYGYAPDALTIDPATGDVRLTNARTPGHGRVRFEPERGPHDTRGGPAGRQVTVYGPCGCVIGCGVLDTRWTKEFRTPSGDMVQLTAFCLGGVDVGYLPNTPLHAGETYRASADISPKLASMARAGPPQLRHQQSEASCGVTCFGPGTMIATQNGEVPVDWLDLSDQVLTRDDGFQNILWIGRTHMTVDHFALHPEDRPVTFAPGTLGPNCPSHPLTVTGCHRILLRSAVAELMFGATEVLAPACAWAEVGQASRQLPRDTYTVTHILLPAHHVIMAEGAWVESMFTGADTFQRLNAMRRAHLKSLVGAGFDTQRTARVCITSGEAAALMAPLRYRAPTGLAPAPGQRRA